MLRWLTNRTSSDRPEGASGAEARAGGKAQSQSQSRYRLEALEPRVLLSADPLALAVAAQAVVQATSNSDKVSANTLVLQPNAGQAPAADAAVQDAQPGQAAQENLTVAWPEGWQATTTGGDQKTPATAATTEPEVPVSVAAAADSEDSNAAQLLQAAAAVASQKDSSFDDKSSPAQTGDDQVAINSPTDEQLPRAPPSEDLFGSAIVAVETNSQSETSPASPEKSDQGGLFAFQNPPISDRN
ncbi:MAG TPA: LEPR-XLL domain-containing protein, partial [Burkholderiales bacterium]|nr:LEPR-XLL domain-containing protein [Burkholderiales bacterium]